MKHTYIIPQVSFEALNTQSLIMVGSAPIGLMFEGSTIDIGGTVRGE